ncbi:MAG: hypothetical protein ACK49V_02570, partial [Actinomycetes bacterium]
PIANGSTTAGGMVESDVSMTATVVSVVSIVFEAGASDVVTASSERSPSSPEHPANKTAESTRRHETRGPGREGLNMGDAFRLFRVLSRRVLDEATS